MKDILKEDRFNSISNDDKAFIIAFDNEMTKLGSGSVWGKYMIIYRKSGVKSKKVFARIYIRDERVVLRLFLIALIIMDNASCHNILSEYSAPTPQCSKKKIMG